MNKKRILIVDEDAVFIQQIKTLMSKKGFVVDIASNAVDVLRYLEANQAGTCVLNIHLADFDGLILLKRIQELYPDINIICTGNYGGLDNALSALKHGAKKFFAKPLSEKHLTWIFREADLSVGDTVVHQHVRPKTSLQRGHMIGDSLPMRKMYEIIEKVADTDATVLIMGESGTGKELVARALHTNGNRSVKLFVPVNCGAIPHDLLESELFGHTKGAFTGAVVPREGRFTIANGGSIFLDEIGDMPLFLQVKLLRVLQEKRYEPVGSSRSIYSDVRIIAATNVDLELQVREKAFREDLFYRLNVLPITVPALRDRQDDIEILVKTFIKSNSQGKNRAVTGISDEVLAIFQRYAWPGNVRELENLIERLVILKGDGLVGVDDIPDKYKQPSISIGGQLGQSNIERLPGFNPASAVDFYKEVENFENQMILKALSHTGWNKNKAAKILNLNRTTLVEKIKKRKLSQGCLVQHVG